MEKRASRAKRHLKVTLADIQEAKRELGLIGDMIKKDPLSPIGYYFKNMVLPGAGLGLEGYALVTSSQSNPAGS